MAKNKLPENAEYQTLKFVLPKDEKRKPLPEEQNLRDFKPNGQEPETKPQTLGLRTDKQFSKNHPMNPDYISPVDQALKDGSASSTGMKNGTGASSAMARELPGEAKSAESKVNPVDVAKENERSFIDRMLTAMGLTPDQKPHAEVALLSRSKGNGGNIAQQDIVDTAQKVSGNDFTNLPQVVQASIASAASGIRNSGTSLDRETPKEDPKMQAMSVVTQPQAGAEVRIG